MDDDSIRQKMCDTHRNQFDQARIIAAVVVCLDYIAKQEAGITADAKKTADDKGVQMYTASEFGKISYYFEHRLLKQQFYSNPNAVIGMLLSKDGVYGAYKAVIESAKQTFPYKSTDFAVNAMKYNSQISMVCLEFPLPEYVPLCYRVYFLFDAEMRHLSYFTVERGMEGGFLCSWDNETHKNYGHMKDPLFTGNKGMFMAIEAKRVAELHAQRYGLSTETEDLTKEKTQEQVITEADNKPRKVEFDVSDDMSPLEYNKVIYDRFHHDLENGTLPYVPEPTAEEIAQCQSERNKRLAILKNRALNANEPFGDYALKKVQSNYEIPVEVEIRVGKISNIYFSNIKPMLGLIHWHDNAMKALYKSMGYNWYTSSEIYPGRRFD